MAAYIDNKGNDPSRIDTISQHEDLMNKQLIALTLAALEPRESDARVNDTAQAVLHPAPK